MERFFTYLDNKDNMKLFTPSQNAHWYRASDGMPMHQVEMKTKPGQMRPTTVRDAKQLGLFPSVTSIIKILSRPQLESWKQEQAVLAALTLPRKDGEPETEFAKRVIADAESIAEQAASKGTKIHNAIEQYLMTGEKVGDPEILLLCEPFFDWAKTNILNVIMCEQVVISRNGYAGRLDLKAEFKDHGVRFADFKSRKPYEGKPRSYPDDSYQLAAYKMADNDTTSGLMSILINSDSPSDPIIKPWETDEENDAKTIFSSCFLIWKTMKKFNPQEHIR